MLEAVLNENLSSLATVLAGLFFAPNLLPSGVVAPPMPDFSSDFYLATLLEFSKKVIPNEVPSACSLVRQEQQGIVSKDSSRVSVDRLWSNILANMDKEALVSVQLSAVRSSESNTRPIQTKCVA